MSMLRTKVVPIAAFTFALCIGLHLNTQKVKADAVASTQQGVVLKSTSLKSNKTIVVPVREAPRVVTTNNSNRSGTVSYSRGLSGGSTVASGSTSSIVNRAFQYLGTPYVYGANGPRAFDCSGFTKYVYASFGISIPRTSQQQSKFGLGVTRSNLRPGDLVFFNTDSYASHVGIYIGGGQFIHASSGSRKVTVSELGSNYYNGRFIGGRRVVN
jgi:peptidoglycan DL-endopeptidase CwlO